MNKLKDKVYDFLVRKNENVCYEYERYVRENIIEHYESHIKHWKILWSLIKHYRIMHRNEPLLYWDHIKPPTPKINNMKSPAPKTNCVKKTAVKLPYHGAESSISGIRAPQHFIKQLMPYDIISFDVFDTLIFRPVAPKDVFKILERENKVQHFALLREKAEKETREQFQNDLGTREITLKDIYEYIFHESGIDISKGMAHEIETELNLCFANPYMLKVYHMLLALGKRIVITTDMYLPQEIIVQILHQNGFYNFEKVYVSGELKMSKATGELFHYMKRDLRTDNLIHIGDNPHSDLKMAKKHELACILYKNVNSIGNTYRTEGLSPLFASAYSCTVNAYIHNGSRIYNIPYELGFIYGGYYILGYVNWIHQFAVQNKIEKIIFLARDGYIYKKVYDELYHDIPSVYMICSRSIIGRCSIRHNRYDFLRRFVLYRVINKQKYTISQICNDLGLQGKEAELKKYYNLNKNSVLTGNNYQMVTNYLIANIQQIETYFAKEQETLKKYLSSLIGNARKIALVDIGWAGSGPKNLKYLIEKEWKFNCTAYGLLACNGSDVNEDGIYTYIFNQSYNRNHFDSHFRNANSKINNDLFETFTQACAPSAKAILPEGKDKLSFKFASPAVEGYETIQNIHRGILDFIKEYTCRFEKYPFLYNISGYDAYLPFRLLKRDIPFFKEFLSSFPVETDTAGSMHEITTLKDFIEKKGL